MTAKRGRRVPRWSYLVAGVAALALIGGFTLGSITIGGFGSTPRQATATAVALAPAGVGFPLAEAKIASVSSVPPQGSCTTPNLGTRISPDLLVSGTNSTLCLTTSLTGFSSGDLLYILDVSFNLSAPVSTHFQIDVFLSMTPAANDLVATGYVETSATIAATEVVTLAADLTQAGDGGIVGFTVIVTQL
jgi:hypothetical protein